MSNSGHMGFWHICVCNGGTMLTTQSQTKKQKNNCFLFNIIILVALRNGCDSWQMGTLTLVLMRLDLIKWRHKKSGAYNYTPADSVVVFNSMNGTKPVLTKNP